MNTRHYEAYAVVLVIAGIFLTALPVRAATILVTSLADPGSLLTCSLRQAITNANRGGATRLSRCMPGTRVNTIIFSPRLTGTINLRQELPAVTGNLTIIGPTGSAGVTIDGRQDFEFDGLMELTPSANLTVQNLTFSNGERFGGGAIFNNEGTLTVDKCTFSANESLAPTGGAIINDGTMLVTNSAFEANVAVTSGGAIANLRDATIEGSTFSNNRAPQGSAVANFTGSTTIVNSTFAGNFSSEGGVVLQRHDNMRIINSTFADNFATEDHARALIVRSGIAMVKGSIFISNDGPNCGGELPTDEGYNISSDNSCSFTGTGSLNDTDPELDPVGLADNGGPTETIALTASSPADELIPVQSCIDQGGAPLTIDQRGFGRPAASHPDFCSAGAYEFEAAQ